MGCVGGKEEVVVKKPAPAAAPAGKSTENTKPLKCKVVVVGTFNSGKTSIVQRVVGGDFVPNIVGDGKPKTKRLIAESRPVDLVLHDTAGQEQYQTVTGGFYDDADAQVFVYDITAEDTFKDLPDWNRQASESAAHSRGRTNPVKILLGNKFDLASSRQVQSAKAEQFAHDNDMTYFEVSAKTGDGLDRAFQQLAEKLAQTTEE